MHLSQQQLFPQQHITPLESVVPDGHPLDGYAGTKLESGTSSKNEILVGKLRFII